MSHDKEVSGVQVASSLLQLPAYYTPPTELLTDYRHNRRAVQEYAVFNKGEIDNRIDPREAIVQLSDPEPDNPVFLVNLKLPSLSDHVFRVSPELSHAVEAYEEANVQVNLTPKYSFVDLHIGTSPRSPAIPG